MRKMYDITMVLKPGMVTWPGNPPFSIEAVNRISQGDASNVSLLHLGTHTGTHIDASRHFLDGYPAVDTIDLEILVGKARLYDLSDVDRIDDNVLNELDFESVSRALFRTRNSNLLDQPHTIDYVSLTRDGAEYLIEKRIKLVGIDYLSIEAYINESYPTHHSLLEKGIVILEGLNLQEVESGDYELVCLPLKLEGSDGAPCRAILIS